MKFNDVVMITWQPVALSEEWNKLVSFKCQSKEIFTGLIRHSDEIHIQYKCLGIQSVF